MSCGANFSAQRFLMKRRLLGACLLTLLASTPFALANHHKQVVLDAETRDAMTPHAVLKDLMKGNERYMSGKLTNQQDIGKQVEKTASGQYPKAIILSCVDSRVPVEQVFDQRIGDIFVARIAGNVENVDILGSMEFATAAAGSKLVMVLGHEACGAVKGACDHVQLGNLTALLEKIQPAVVAVQADFPAEDQNSKNAEFVARVIEENVRITVADIRRNSPVLAGLEAEGKIKIVGANYSLQTGAVTLID
jgi:carbonic anhydrase